MLNRRSLALVFVGAFALLLSACGARQKGGGAHLRANWHTAIEAVPADAQGTLGLRMNSGSAASWLSSIVKKHGPGQAPMLEVLQDSEQTGDHLAAIFVYRNALWLVARVNDTPAAMQTIEDGFAQQKEEVVHSLVGPYPMLSRNDGRDRVVGAGDYLILVAHSPRDFTADGLTESIKDLLRGWPGERAFVKTKTWKANAKKIGDKTLTAWLHVDPLRLFDLIMDDEPGDVKTTREAKCYANARKILKKLPTIDLITLRDTDGLQSMNAFLHLSEAADQRAHELMAGVADFSGLGRDVLLKLGVSFDFGSFFAQMRDAPQLHGCGDGLRVVKELREFAARNQKDIQKMATMVSGTGLWVLRDLKFMGMLPRPQWGLRLQSPDAPALMALIREKFQGGRASVAPVENADVPTLEIRLLHGMYHYRAEQFPHDVVITGSELPIALADVLRSSADVENSPIVFEMFLNATKFRELVDSLTSMFDDSHRDTSKLKDASAIAQKVHGGVVLKIMFENDGLRVIAFETGVNSP